MLVMLEQADNAMWVVGMQRVLMSYCLASSIVVSVSLVWVSWQGRVGHASGDRHLQFLFRCLSFCNSGLSWHLALLTQPLC